MSRSPAKRKQHVGPDLGLAPGERGFAKWLRQKWLARTDRLLAQPARKRRKAG